MTTAWHRLIDTKEQYVILSGVGVVEVEGISPTEVSAGAVVHIPEGKLQRIKNTGDESLVFLAICTRFLPENYEQIEDF